MSNKVGRIVRHRNDEQKYFLEALNNFDLTMVEARFGSGKTACAVGHGCELLLHKKIEKFYLIRSVGHLSSVVGHTPGTVHEKCANFFAQQIEYLCQFLGSRQKYEEFVRDGKIKLLPIGLLQGLSLDNSYVFCDEMQNSSKQEFQMLLSRWGRGTTMCWAGDRLQSGRGENCYFARLFDNLEDESIRKVTLTECFRHKSLVRIFNKMDKI